MTTPTAELRALIQDEASELRRTLGRAESVTSPSEVLALINKFRAASGLVEMYLERLRKLLETP